MFKELYTMLNASNHYGISEDIEILKGKYAKMNLWDDFKIKKIRKSKFSK